MEKPNEEKKASPTPIVKFKEVSKTFGDIVALENISFDIQKGEFIFITGHSGAGKSTLLRLLLGGVVPEMGEVMFEGRDLSHLSSKDLPAHRQKIGVVFQDFKVLPERTLRENVEVALAVIGVPQEEWRDRVDQVLKLSGILQRSELFPSQLSGGELQRVSLARALVVNPRIVLADEPTGNLDWETTDSIMDLFDTINKEGKTVVVATHNRRIIDKFKRRVVELKQGKLVKDGKHSK